MTSTKSRAELTEKLLDIKREKGWTWKYICGEIGGMSPVLITGAILGQMKLTKPQAAKAAELFALSKSEQALLNEVPHRGSAMPPTDPLIYRFYELVMVNGPALKVLIEEEFGDGIMSAIDFDLGIERQPDPKGDRVKIAMSGKFLPYKYYGATGNAQAYGYKEDYPLREPTGPARSGRPDDRLRDEAIRSWCSLLDCFAWLAMTALTNADCSGGGNCCRSSNGPC
jgi:cyanate lyase